MGPRRRGKSGSRRSDPGGCGQLGSGNAVVAKHDLVATVFFVAAVFAALPVLRRALLQWNDLHLDALLRDETGDRRGGEVGTGEGVEVAESESHRVLDE